MSWYSGSLGEWIGTVGTDILGVPVGVLVLGGGGVVRLVVGGVVRLVVGGVVRLCGVLTMGDKLRKNLLFLSVSLPVPSTLTLY